MLGIPRPVLVALAVVVVIGGVLRFENAGRPNPAQSNDERAYVMIARNLVERGHYGADAMKDPAHWPPGAPLLFAGAMKLTGELPPTTGAWDLPGVYAVQAFVATLTILAAFALAALIAGPWAGLAAAIVVALYPPLIYNTSDLLSEPLGAFLLTAGLAATVAALRRPRAWRLLLAGALLGATILTRADLLAVPLIALAVVGVVAWRRAARRRAVAGLRAAALLGIATVVVILPWTIFASNQADKLVPLTTGGGSNFWMGTYLPGKGTLFGSKRAMAPEVRRRHPGYRDARWQDMQQIYVLETVAARHPGIPQDESLRREAWHNLRIYALGHPVAFAKMMLRKAWRMWGKPPTGTGRVDRTWITALHLAILGLSVVGLIAGLAVTRRAALWLILLSVAYVTALNMILVAEARHAVTSVPSLVCGGVAGFVLAWPRLRALLDRRRDARPRAATGTAT